VKKLELLLLNFCFSYKPGYNPVARLVRIAEAPFPPTAMSITLNKAAVAFAKDLIKEGKIKNDEGHWGQHNPGSTEENTFLKKHEIDEYAKWHLGEDKSQGEDTKGRYKFPYGDFKTVHRDGLIAAKERAAQQGYQDIEKAADELLGALEKKAA
jgi:hypothetical protein